MCIRDSLPPQQARGHSQKVGHLAVLQHATHPHGHLRRELGYLGLRAVVAVAHHAGVAVEHGTCGRKLHAVAHAPQQVGAHVLLKGGHVLAQGRLGGVEPPGGNGQAQVVGNGKIFAQVLDVHGHIPSSNGRFRHRPKKKNLRGVMRKDKFLIPTARIIPKTAEQPGRSQAKPAPATAGRPWNGHGGSDASKGKKEGGNMSSLSMSCLLYTSRCV